MKTSSLAKTVLIFVALAYSVFPGAEAIRTENPSPTLPVITVELLNNQDKVLKYAPPSPGHSYERLSVESPLSFSNESIIFWESKDYNNTGSGSGREIKLRLKCEAPYLTKWKITTHSTAKAEDTKPFYDINYSVKKLPRDRENPLLFTQSNQDGEEFLYSLTELTVNGFGPEFKGGFINCVSRLDESVKSQLYIFQRFGANDRRKSVDQISRGVEDLTHLPCIVYDPDVTIKYEQYVATYQEYKALEASFTTYNWKLGYRIIRGGGRDYRVGNKARCVLDNGRYVYYEHIAKNKTLKGTIKLTQSWNQDENISPSDFVCTIENRDQAPGASIQLEPCVSPNYCFSHPSANTNSYSDGNRNNNTGEQDAQIQGKVSCSPQIQDLYFTGLSGKIYLLSQSPAPPHDDVISMSIIEDQDLKEIRISCSTIQFLTSEPIEFSIRYPSNSNKPPKLLREVFPSVSEGRVGWVKSAYTKTVVLDFDHVEGVQGLSCHVPWFNSDKWISVKKDLKHRYFGGKRIPSGFNEIKTSPNPYQEMNAGSFHNRERLIQDVFHTEANDYTWNYPSNLTVELGVSLISLHGNPLENSLHTNVLLRQLWIDPRFQWNPADYGGEHGIIIASGKILKPDIKLLNSVTLPSIESCAQHTNIHVSNEGQILWITPCQFISTCNFSRSSSNYDSKTCSLKFGTWSDDGFVKDIQFYKNKPEVDLELYDGGTQWNVTGSTGQRVEKTSKGGYGDIFPASLKFDIEFHEKAMSSYGR